MPKGFSRKAIEGFVQWMTATLAATGLDESEVAKSVGKTKNLMQKGFPQIRKY